MVAGGLLAVAMPMAMAQSYTYDINGTSVTEFGDVTSTTAADVFPSKSLHVGVLLDTKSTDSLAPFVGYWQPVGHWVNAQKDSNALAWNVYNVGNISLTSTSANTSGNAGVMAVATNDATGVFNLGNITISGVAATTDELAGFIYRADGDFEGVINGKNITVTSTDSTDAYGAYFRNTALAAPPYWADLTGEVSFDTIKVASTGASAGNAVGFVAGSVNGTSASFASVSIKEIDVTGGPGSAWAMGAQINGANEFGSFIVDTLTVIGDGSAGGIRLGESGVVANVIGTVYAGKMVVKAEGDDAYGFRDFNGTMTGNGMLIAGSIKVTSTAGNADGFLIGSAFGGTLAAGEIVATASGDAAGIRVNGDANIFLSGDITAVSDGGNAVGVKTAGQASITLGNDVKVVGQGSGQGTGFDIDGGEFNLKGNLLVTNGLVTTDDVAIFGNGRANLGDGLDMGSNALIIGDAPGDTTQVAFNFAKAVDLGDENNFLGADATLILYGELSSISDPVWKFTDDADDFKGNLYSMAIFTEYTKDSNNMHINASHLDKANMSDAYVVAMLMHNRYAAWNAVRDRMISGNDNSRLFRGQICDPCGPLGKGFCDPCDAVGCDPCDPCGLFGGDRYCNGGNGCGNGYGNGCGNGYGNGCGDGYGNGCGDGCGRGFGFGGFSLGSAARNAWVAYTGRSDRFESSYRFNNEWRLSTEGVQVGTDLYKSRRAQLGVLFGYEGGNATSRNWFNATSDRVEMEDYYFGFYGARVFRGGADARIVFAGGRQKFDLVRRMDANGLTTYTADFKGRTSETNLELGKRLYSGRAWSIRPVVAIDVFTNRLKGAAEAGAGNNRVAYNKASFNQVFFRFGSDLRWQARNLTVNSGLYYAYDVCGDDLKAKVVGNVSQINDTLSAHLYGSKVGRSMLTYNLGTDIQVARNFSIFGGYDAQYITDRSNKRVNSMGHVGAAVRW